MIIEIFDENKESVTVSNLEELMNLPNLSIVILINNEDCMKVIRLYTLLKFQFALEKMSYTSETQNMHFSTCTEEILTDPSLKLSSRLVSVYEQCLMYMRAQISGILSVTPYLDERQFDKECVKFMKHNYAEAVAALSCN